MASKKGFKPPVKKQVASSKPAQAKDGGKPLSNSQYNEIFDAVLHFQGNRSPVQAESMKIRATEPGESASTGNSQSSQADVELNPENRATVDGESQLSASKQSVATQFSASKQSVALKKPTDSNSSTVCSGQSVKPKFKRPNTLREALKVQESSSQFSSSLSQLGSSSLLLAQDAVLSQAPKHLRHRQRLQWLQDRRGVGLYIQCDVCKKWRWSDIDDPVDVPKKWTCRQNPDNNYNECIIPEKPISVYIEEDLIHNDYTAGSIVWAKLFGYPWWPAMVDDCPDTEQYYWLDGYSDIPTFYHVVFFDYDSNEISRSWVPVRALVSFKQQPGLDNKFSMKPGHKSRIESAKLQAQAALKLRVKERLLKYSFLARWTGEIITPPPSDTELPKAASAKSRKAGKKRKQRKLSSSKELTTDELGDTSDEEPEPRMRKSKDRKHNNQVGKASRQDEDKQSRSEKINKKINGRETDDCSSKDAQSKDTRLRGTRKANEAKSEEDDGRNGGLSNDDTERSEETAKMGAKKDASKGKRLRGVQLEIAKGTGFNRGSKASYGEEGQENGASEGEEDEDKEMEPSGDEQAESSEAEQAEDAEVEQREASEDEQMKASQDKQAKASLDEQAEASEDSEIEASKDKQVLSAREEPMEALEDEQMDASQDEQTEASQDEIMDASADKQAEASEDEQMDASEDQQAEASEDEQMDASQDEQLKSSQVEHAEAAQDEQVESSEDEEVASPQYEHIEASQAKQPTSLQAKQLNSLQAKQPNSLQAKQLNSLQDNQAEASQNKPLDSAQPKQPSKPSQTSLSKTKRTKHTTKDAKPRTSAEHRSKHSSQLKEHTVTRNKHYETEPPKDRMDGKPGGMSSERSRNKKSTKDDAQSSFCADKQSEVKEPVSSETKSRIRGSGKSERRAKHSQNTSKTITPAVNAFKVKSQKSNGNHRSQHASAKLPGDSSKGKSDKLSEKERKTSRKTQSTNDSTKSKAKLSTDIKPRTEEANDLDASTELSGSQSSISEKSFVRITHKVARIVGEPIRAESHTELADSQEETQDFLSAKPAAEDRATDDHETRLDSAAEEDKTQDFVLATAAEDEETQDLILATAAEEDRADLISAKVAAETQPTDDDETQMASSAEAPDDEDTCSEPEPMYSQDSSMESFALNSEFLLEESGTEEHNLKHYMAQALGEHVNIFETSAQSISEEDDEGLRRLQEHITRSQQLEPDRKPVKTNTAADKLTAKDVNVTETVAAKKTAENLAKKPDEATVKSGKRKAGLESDNSDGERKGMKKKKDGSSGGEQATNNSEKKGKSGGKENREMRDVSKKRTGKKRSGQEDDEKRRKIARTERENGENGTRDAKNDSKDAKSDSKVGKSDSKAAHDETNAKSDSKIAKSGTKDAKNDSKVARSDSKLAKNDTIAKNDSKLAKNDTKPAKSDTKLAKSDSKLAKNDTNLAKSDTKLANDTKTAKNDTKVGKSDTKLAKSDSKLAKSDTKVPKNDTNAKSDTKVGKSDSKLAKSDKKVATNDTKIAKSDTNALSATKIAKSDTKLAKTDTKLAKTDKKLPKSDTKLTKPDTKHSSNDTNQPSTSGLNNTVKKTKKTKFFQPPLRKSSNSESFKSEEYSEQNLDTTSSQSLISSSVAVVPNSEDRLLEVLQILSPESPPFDP